MSGQINRRSALVPPVGGPPGKPYRIGAAWLATWFLLGKSLILAVSTARNRVADRPPSGVGAIAWLPAGLATSR